MKYEYTIVFRNGYVFKFKADGCEAETGVTENGHTTMKYAKFLGKAQGEHPVYYSLDDIVLITANELVQDYAITAKE